MPLPKTNARWTQDTRTAFLLGLRLTGGVRLAAAEIGRDVGGCYKVRERDADFAAAWDAIVVAQRAARRAERFTPDAGGAVGGAAGSGPGGAAATELDAANQRKRRDGLTLLKRRAFLRSLSETGTVEAACRAARVSDTAAYRLRGDDADFAAAWDRALRSAAPALDQVAWERAVEGWEEPVYAAGKQVGTRRRYSETLLRQLLLKREKAAALADDPAALARRAHEAARAAGGEFGTPATREATNAAILKKLKAIEGRLGLPPLAPALVSSEEAAAPAAAAAADGSGAGAGGAGDGDGLTAAGGADDKAA